MEPVGLAVGVAGLAGLFTSCIDCFELVQRGRYFGADYLILETKYSNQRLRLWAWGRACGIAHDGGPDSCGRPVWSDDVVSAVEETLVQIATLFQNHEKLSRQYGLTAVSTSSAPKPVGPSVLSGLVPRLKATNLARLIRAQPTREIDKSPKFPTAARWAIEGKDKFGDLVQHLKDFIDDLEALTAQSDDGVRQRQRSYIHNEVGSIYDISELETIERARMAGRDAVADAASIRLCQIQENAEPQPAQSERSQVEDNEWVNVPRATLHTSDDPLAKYSQTVYRVTCDLCPARMFLDEPSYALSSESDDQWMVLGDQDSLRVPTCLHLSGKRPIPNLASFLNVNPQLYWIVLNDYTCSHDFHNLRHASIQKTSIRLLSPALANSLNARLSLDQSAFAKFESGTELSPPYPWYHRHRTWLQKQWVPTCCWSEVIQCCLKEHDAVAYGLIQYIETSMADEYKQFKKSLQSKRFIKWEHLPLVFVSCHCAFHAPRIDST
jgi:hypothetical protein